MNDVLIKIQLKDRFLDTAARVEMPGPVGTLTYLDMVEIPGKTEPGEIPQISVQPVTKVIHTERRQVVSSVTYEQLSDLDKIGIDGKAQLVPVMVSETISETQKELLEKYTNMGIEHAVAYQTKWQKILNEWFKIEFPVYTGDNTLNRIVRQCHFIGSTSRRGRGNFVVVNTQILVELEKSPNFTYPEFEKIELGGPIKYVGSINDIAVYLNPFWSFNQTQVVIGRSTRNSEPGVYFGEYSREIIETEEFGPEHRLKVGLISRQAIVSTPDAVKSFWVEKIKPEKKPFWRKLLGI